jgi:WXG100 family type VII secretion target
VGSVSQPFESEEASLLQGSSVVQSTHDDVQADLAKLRNIVSDLMTHGWEGKASLTFGQVMTDWDTNAKKLLDALSRIGQLLQTSGVTFTAGDEDANKLINRTANYSGILGSKS